MRYNAAGQNAEIVARAIGGPARNASIFLMGVLGALFVLLLSSRAVLAEPAALAPLSDLVTEPTLVAIEIESHASPFVAWSLDALLEIPDLTPLLSRAEITDEALAAAVELGTNPDLQRLSGFRKRSQDLFRTERPVEIGKQEMLLRLRLRAKKRNAMSVELRF